MHYKSFDDVLPSSKIPHMASLQNCHALFTRGIQLPFAMSARRASMVPNLCVKGIAMFRKLCTRIALAMLLLVASASSHALFHAWYISEVYSNADGTVQSMKLNHAIMDEASAAPPITTTLE